MSYTLRFNTATHAYRASVCSFLWSNMAPLLGWYFVFHSENVSHTKHVNAKNHGCCNFDVPHGPVFQSCLQTCHHRNLPSTHRTQSLKTCIWHKTTISTHIMNHLGLILSLVQWAEVEVEWDWTQTTCACAGEADPFAAPLQKSLLHCIAQLCLPWMHEDFSAFYDRFFHWASNFYSLTP